MDFAKEKNEINISCLYPF